MNQHYMVKFISNQELRYGTVDSLSSKALELAKEGKLLIENAVFPQTHEIQEKYVTDISREDMLKFLNHMYDFAMKNSKTIRGCQVGKIVVFDSFGRDAFYIITKVLKNEVVLEWRGFTLDTIVNEVLGYGGKMDKERLEKKIQAEESRLSTILADNNGDCELKSDL